MAKAATDFVKRFFKWNNPLGFWSTQFWGPVANWGIPIAGFKAWNNDPEYISRDMTAVLCVYSGLFMRFAVVIEPKNYILFACHATNEIAQLGQLYRVLKYQYVDKPKKLLPASNVTEPKKPATEASSH